MSELIPIEERLPLWGTHLLEAIHTTRVAREPLIEGVLFKKSAHMIYAPSGIGKSTVSLQEAVQGTVEGKVFGEFHVPKPFNTLYLQMERSEDEALERLKTMIEHTPFDHNRFVLDTSFQEFNFKLEKHVTAALERMGKIIKSTFGHADLVKVDPIYTMIPGGLKDDEGASHIINFSKMIQYKFGSSVSMVHHTNRGIKDQETGERKGADMFGSGLFTWHCTGIYAMNKTKDGTCLTRDKSSQSNMEKKIDLVFNAESQLSYVKNSQNKLSKTDLLTNYLKACKVQDKTFTFDDMIEVSGVSTAYLRGLQGRHLKTELSIVGKSPTGAHLYKYLG